MQAQAPPAAAESGTRALTGGALIAHTLDALGITHFFNVPGQGVYHLIDHLVDTPRIQYVMALHEFAAVGIADGYARMTRRPSFVNVFMTPGLAYGLGALDAAYKDGTPLVLTVTQQPTSVVGRGELGECTHQVQIAREFTKWAFEVPRADRLGEALVRAFKVAATPPTGPVCLSLPVDLFEEQVSAAVPEADRYAVWSVQPPDPAAVERAAALLLAAERPLLMAGGELARAGAWPVLVELAELLGAPVVLEPHAVYLGFPTDHPLCLGRWALVPDLLDGCDLLVAAGARMFTHIGPPIQLPAALRTIMFHSDPAEIGKVYPADVGIAAEAGTTMRALLAAVRARTGGRPTQGAAARGEQVRARVRALRAAAAERARDGWDAVPLRRARLFSELRRAVPTDTYVVDDLITSRGYLAAYCDFPRPDRYIGSWSANAGWGMPAAVGVQLARPGEPVVLCQGDGGFVFANQALWTAVRHELPLVVVVANNQGYGAMRASAGRLCVKANAAGYEFGFAWEPRVDVAGIARSYGMDALTVERPGGVGEAIQAALARQRPVVIDARVDPDEGPYLGKLL